MWVGIYKSILNTKYSVQGNWILFNGRIEMSTQDMTVARLLDLLNKSGDIDSTADIHVYVEARYELDNILRIPTEQYHQIVEEAKQQNKSPVYICSTPVGVWRFNLEFFSPGEDGPYVYLNTYKATPMLPWWPTYDSEEEWIAQQMIEYSDEEPYADDLELLIEDMLNSEVDFDNEFETNE
jgi:hypothetical protein